MKQTAGTSLNTIPYQALLACVGVFSIFICFCMQSNRFQAGGSNLDPTVDEIFQKTLKPWTERSQVPPKHLKVSSDHFGGWLEASNHPPSFEKFHQQCTAVESRFLPPTWERLD